MAGLEQFRRPFAAMALAVAGLSFAPLPAAAQNGGSAAVSADQPSGGENLSSKLSRSGGVITPKADVDPGMHVPAPDPHPNSTPVIPPSATGGGSAK
jgi:hypothetical protein